MKAAAIIVCAGAGRRLGQPKAGFLLEGKPLFYYSLKVFLETAGIKQVVLVLQKKHFQLAKKFIQDSRVTLTEGAKARKQSVECGLAKVKDELGYVLVHDCARPFISKKTVSSLIKNLKECPAVIPGLRTSDTLRQVVNRLAGKTLKRDNIFLIQTPQGFRKDLIKKAYEKTKKAGAADSAQLVIKYGQKVRVIEGDPLNFKITYPKDIHLARNLWKIIKQA